ncbi:MAG: pyridine nucleotide-disulfide oxidoreductase [Phycisphaerales bacterium]|nr:pyridine nucleotide-disulfide oxidoreductase [Phycisphaerales bacterium]
MAEEVFITIDGKPVQLPAGCTVAAAVCMATGGVSRQSASGQSRGPICGMGICFECRVEIDGKQQCRSCQTPARAGTEIVTGASERVAPRQGDLQVPGDQTPSPSYSGERAGVRGRASNGSVLPSTVVGFFSGPASTHPTEEYPRRNASEHAFDVIVIGAGPAGLAAACCASESGRRVAVIDDNPAAGGQIWRAQEDHPSTADASQWFDRVRKCDFALFPGTQIIGAISPGKLLAEAGGEARVFTCDRLILAAGARELFLPFPGWTLPNVMGAGGLQAMVKSGLPIEGKRVVVAGSGPLLLAVAAYLRERGADVRLIAEQAPRKNLARFGLGLLRHPGKFRQAVSLRRELRGIRYASGCWPIMAAGEGRLASVTLSDGRTDWTEHCDYLACGFGLVPNTDLAALLGCTIVAGAVHVDDSQETSVPRVYAAGEITGVGGLDLSLLEGQIAGYAAADRPGTTRALFRARGKARAFARRLGQTFALREELRALPRAGTIVCRCEDVTFERLAGHSSWLAAKLQTRCGMGPCQGRVCGPAVEALFGWERQSIRPPIFPADVQSLIDVYR